MAAAARDGAGCFQGRRVIRVAVVDDQVLVRAGFAMLINSQADLEVVGEAGDGVEAIDLLARTPADVVLMDARMPRLDGVEATRRIIAERPDGPKVVAPFPS